MKAQKPYADTTIITKFIFEITKDWLNARDQGEKFELRCLGEHRTPVTECFTLDAIDRAVDLALEMNANGLNVYTTINSINPSAVIKAGKGATDPDILRAHYSFADADDLQGLAGINQLVHPYEPDILVTTGTTPHERRHAYWRLAEPCQDLHLWRETQKSIASKLKTDPSVCNPSRIMRVAGTVSYPSQSKLTRGYIPELVTLKVRDT
ncbi:MAG: hypothetical protein O3A15_02355 [Proteobacteria bacterium]|nr:hypothetical protein [Pseudomonadota bacterium]